MYIYHALINAMSAHMIHINLNVIFYTHVEHSPTKTTHTMHCTERQREKRKVVTLALKDDRVEQCLRSCGSEFQMWGSKQEKVRKRGISFAFVLLDFKHTGVIVWTHENTEHTGRNGI